MKLSRRSVLAGTAGLLALGPLGAATRRAAGDFDSEVNDTGIAEFTGESRASIDRGTRWLLKALNRDGGAGIDINTPSDVACTSVVGMAFLSQGNTPLEGAYWREQRNVSEFLLGAVERMGSDGRLQAARSQIEGDLGPYATHFFSTIFLSQAIGEAHSVDRFYTALNRLEGYISGGQLRDGSWGTNAWAPMLATAVGWLSLRAANFAGVKVSGSSEAAGDFLIRQMPDLGAQWGSGSWYHRLYGTAAGLRVLYAMQRDDEEVAKQALADVMALVQGNNQTFGAAGGEEYLTFHLLTEMLMQKGGEDWAIWYPIVRDKLIDVQNADGSWTGHHCITSRTFSTACALMVLTAPNRYLPISQV